MPTFRSYPQATSIVSTDAFVLDRIGQGTMFIDAINTMGGFRANLRSPPANPYSAAPVQRVPYDTIDFDTTGGFSTTTTIPGISGTVSALTVKQPGYYFFTTSTQLHDTDTTTHSVSILQSISVLSSSGADVEFVQVNTPAVAIGASPASSQTFSASASWMVSLSAGQFVFVSTDLESAATSATLQWNASTSTNSVTYFAGYQVR